MIALANKYIEKENVDALILACTELPLAIKPEDVNVPIVNTTQVHINAIYQYNYEYDGFVFVDELGERMKPDYLTSQFPAFIQRHGMKKMRFHDLRHSCASLLLANGVPLKQIQDWLGHSDFSTTANIYAHLDYSSKLSSAQAMVSGMPLPEAGDFGSRWEQSAEKSGE